MADAGRRAQLAANLDEVRGRIARACRAAGREPESVTLIAITKTYPASDVELLASLGVTDIGENKDQEASAKAAAVQASVRWHFVGQLQRNKVRSVVRYADVVQSVDSVRLASALARAAEAHRSAPLEVLVQVSLDGDASRGGVAEPDIWDVVETVAWSPALRLGGLMAVAPMDWPPDRAFSDLSVLSERLRAVHPTATVISAGMSGDLEEAIKHGATHVRIGTSLLGMRKTLR
ncbi:MAG TPA: YggS family pyridoxal phosphate-dependent enzyme [Actinoplanes sp.]|nr:YggS family pyridoxal phosphate-dependent enzyme [Actinoplanes sp.]